MARPVHRGNQSGEIIALNFLSVYLPQSTCPSFPERARAEGHKTELQQQEQAVVSIHAPHKKRGLSPIHVMNKNVLLINRPPVEKHLKVTQVVYPVTRVTFSSMHLVVDAVYLPDQKRTLRKTTLHPYLSSMSDRKFSHRPESFLTAACASLSLIVIVIMAKVFF